MLAVINEPLAAKEKTSVSRLWSSDEQKNKKVRMSSRIDLADALRKESCSVHSHLMVLTA